MQKPFPLCSVEARSAPYGGQRGSYQGTTFSRAEPSCSGDGFSRSAWPSAPERESLNRSLAGMAEAMPWYEAPTRNFEILQLCSLLLLMPRAQQIHVQPDGAGHAGGQFAEK